VVPQRLNINESNASAEVYFRVRQEEKNCILHIAADGKEIFRKKYMFMRPPEMESLVIDFDQCELTENSSVELWLERMIVKGDDAS